VDIDILFTLSQQILVERPGFTFVSNIKYE